jgi:hypothetical protein
MNHDEIADLLGAYALDAVDDDERAEIEAHLVDCARCRAEVNEHREVATLLAHSGADAPEGVWSRIAGALDQPPPDLRLVPEPASQPTAPVRRVPRLAAALVAAAAGVVAVLGFQVRQQDQRIDELQAAVADPLAPAFEAALDAPDSQLVELTSADGTIVLRGAVTDDGTGYLRASALPRLDLDRTYQLWGAAGDELVSLGVLGAEPDVVTFGARDFDGFAITEEDAPGVVTSRNRPVVTGTTV